MRKLIFIAILCVILMAACTENNQNKTSAEPSLTPSTTESEGVTPSNLPSETQIELIDAYRFTYVKYEKEYDIIPCFSYSDCVSNNILRCMYTVDNKTTYGFMDLDFNIVYLPNLIEPSIFTNDLSVVWPDGNQIRPVVLNTEMQEINVIPFEPFMYNDSWYHFYIEEPRDETKINNKSFYTAKFDIEKYANIDPHKYLVPVSLICSHDPNENANENGHEHELLWGYKSFYDVYIAKNDDTNFMIPPIYNVVGEFKYGIAPVCINDKWGYIDESGETVIEFKFDIAMEFNDNVALVGTKDKTSSDGTTGAYNWGIIDFKGNLLTSKPYFSIEKFKNNIAVVSRDGKKNIVDLSGKEMLEKDYFDIEICDNGIILVRDEKGYYFIDLAENMLGVMRFDNAMVFKDGLAPVLINNQWGYIGIDGNYIIEPQYQLALNFNQGFALVRKYDDTFLIDKAGNEKLHELMLSNISEFNLDGYAMAYSDKKTPEGLPIRTFYIVHKQKNSSD